MSNAPNHTFYVDQESFELDHVLNQLDDLCYRIQREHLLGRQHFLENENAVMYLQLQELRLICAQIELENARLENRITEMILEHVANAVSAEKN
ncbi:hypothetical protein QR680_006924 [Steinernema hermaphroditum]|uniref:Uncharacterized protein n=1 Tax=Steinernema hermaphroditum TaxID=289476 RepID=A0AA39HWZ6_9BILA|nr:hypothetical protein QR680_006924 [Steinernema hermaphroditum]